MLTWLLLLLAFVAFAVAAVGVEAKRVNLLAAGLALWALTLVVQTWPG